MRTHQRCHSRSTPAACCAHAQSFRSAIFVEACAMQSSLRDDSINPFEPSSASAMLERREPSASVPPASAGARDGGDSSRRPRVPVTVPMSAISVSRHGSNPNAKPCTAFLTSSHAWLSRRGMFDTRPPLRSGCPFVLFPRLDCHGLLVWPKFAPVRS